MQQQQHARPKFACKEAQQLSYALTGPMHIDRTLAQRTATPNTHTNVVCCVTDHCLVDAGEAPLGEWEAWRVRPSYDGPLTSQDPAAAEATDTADAEVGGGGSSGSSTGRRSPRRLVLTARALLERRTDSYEVGTYVSYRLSIHVSGH